MLEDGRVVDVGPHRELIAAAGPYARLWASYLGSGDATHAAAAAKGG
jgi:ABC-type multidrug transport system fused ATPase/permease subunit